MKIEFNWGTGIFLVIALFLIASFLAIQFAFKQKINLVTEDYYPKELEYQEVIDKKTNVEKHGKHILLREYDSKIYLIFPDSVAPAQVTGNIHFYRPSDFEKDILYPVSLNDSLIQVFNAEDFSYGKYKVFVDWEYNGTGFFQELSMYIIQK